jgi:hypothetical protein
LVEQNESLVAQSTSSIVDIFVYREAKRLHSLHSKINPHCERSFQEIYNNVSQLVAKNADKDVDGRSKVLRKKAGRKRA